jgi:hypothetical protein
MTEKLKPSQMYANLNASEKLTVQRSDKNGYRFLYKIINKEHNTVLLTRYANRKFVAATISGMFFSMLEQATAYSHEMKREGVKDYIVDTYFCYLEDATAFDEPKPELAWKG